jgi:hypothetical protein
VEAGVGAGETEVLAEVEDSGGTNEIFRVVSDSQMSCAASGAWQVGWIKEITL